MLIKIIFVCFVSILLEPCHANEIWKDIDNLIWEAEKNANGGFDLTNKMAISWLPVDQVSGRWIRLSATTRGRSKFKAWLHMFQAEKSLIRPMNLVCDDRSDALVCTAIAWIPVSYSQRVRASFYSDDSAISVFNVRVEFLEQDQSDPKNAKRFATIFNQLKSEFFKSEDVSWDEVEQWVTPALKAPLSVDPIPFMMALVANKLPSDGHTYVYRNQVAEEEPSVLPIIASEEKVRCSVYNKNTGVLVVPAPPVATKQIAAYTEAAHHCLKAPGVSHWLVDLRSNLGGNAAVQIAALAPLLGTGVSMQYINSRGELIPVRIDHTGVFNQRTIQYRFPKSFRSIRPSVRVTALIGPNCASACEALAIAILSRENSKLIGQPTRGLATANETVELNTEFSMTLTAGYMANRNGKIIYPRVVPDSRMDDAGIERILRLYGVQ